MQRTNELECVVFRLICSEVRQQLAMVPGWSDSVVYLWSTSSERMVLTMCKVKFLLR